MRIIILSIAFLFLAFSAQSQVLKSAGVWYFLDVDSMTARPAVLPNGTELAYVVGTKTVYYWNRATSTWTAYGSTFGRDSIYFDSSIVGSGTVSDPWGVDSTLFATIAGVGDSIAAALVGYVEIADTNTMLLKYPSTVGYGIIDGGKTWRADTTSPNGLATRLFTKTLPTSILTTQIVHSNGSNLVGNTNYTYNSATGVVSNIFSTGSILKMYSGVNNSGSPQIELGNANNSSTSATIKGTASGAGGRVNLDFLTNNILHMRINQGNSSNPSTQFFKHVIIGDSVTIASAVNNTGNKHIYFNASSNFPNRGNASIIAVPTGSNANIAGFGFAINNAGASAWGNATTSDFALYVNNNKNVLIGTTTDVPQSIFTVGGVTKGSLPFPRGTTTERNAITGVAHLNFGNTTTNTTDVYDAVAGAWTSYGRLNATQSWTGTNTFQANGTNGAINWRAGNTSYATAVSLQTRANAPYTGTFWGLYYGTNAGYSFDVGNNGALAMYANGQITMQSGLGSSGGLNIQLNAYGGSISNNAWNNFLSQTTITNPATNSGNIRNTAITPTVSIGHANTIVLTGLYYAPVISGTAPGTHRFIETVTGDWYVGSTSGVMGVRTAPDAAYELKLNGDLFVQDSTRLTTTPAHSAITGLLTRDANGWVGLASLAGGLSYSGGVLSASGVNTIYTASDSIRGDRYLEMANDGSATTALGYFPSFPSASYSSPNYGLIVSGSEVGLYNNDAYLYISSSGNWNLATSNILTQYADNQYRKFDRIARQSGINIIMDFDSLGLAFQSNSNRYRLIPDINSDRPSATSGTKTVLQWTGDGSDANPSFAEVKRDTTIFVTADTDYDFSAAVTTAQIASRYNRIIIHMTLTSGVGADKTTTLHAPDANLMQCEILIRGTDNTGTYDNEIAFGTNNAISSDGTNTSGYTLAQGQGLHVRVVYNGSAYKYIYY